MGDVFVCDKNWRLISGLVISEITVNAMSQQTHSGIIIRLKNLLLGNKVESRLFKVFKDSELINIKWVGDSGTIHYDDCKIFKFNRNYDPNHINFEEMWIQAKFVSDKPIKNKEPFVFR